MAKKITIEELALMVKRGFDQTATKDEVREIKALVQDVVEELGATHADIRNIRSTVTALSRSETAHEVTIENLTERVYRLEQKVGLAK